MDMCVSRPSQVQTGLSPTWPPEYQASGPPPGHTIQVGLGISGCRYKGLNTKILLFFLIIVFARLCVWASVCLSD